MRTTKGISRSRRAGANHAKKRRRKLRLQALEPRQVMAASDPFSADAPTFDTAAPEPTTFQLGDYGIAERTGAATYSYAVAVPPGRQGMAPSLQLSYSSRAPLRGGVAAGWGLDLPSIELDTSSGTLDEPHFMASLGGATGPLVETSDLADRGGTTFRVENDDNFTIFERYTPITSAIPGGPNRDAVLANPFGVASAPATSTPTSRGDSMLTMQSLAAQSPFTLTFQQTNRDGIRPQVTDISPEDNLVAQTDGGNSGSESDEDQRTAWLARTTDGVTHYFGSSVRSSDGTTRWHLDRQVDRNGNTVRYNWAAVKNYDGETIDYALESIEYTSNPNAELEAHARVAFEYADLDVVPGTRTPIGSAVDYRAGRLYYEGAQRMTAIVTQVRDEPGQDWRDLRRVSLSYDMEALGYEDGQLTGRTDGAPLRILTQIDAAAYAPDGSETTVPPVTFMYGDWTRSLEVSKTITSSSAIDASPSHSGTRDDLLSTLLDIDGDGLSDRVETRVADGVQSTTPAGLCELVWHRGLYGGGYAAEEHTIDLPSYPWANGDAPSGDERCTLMGQYTRMRNRQPAQGANVSQAENLFVYHFADVDGDGDHDLMTALHFDKKFYDPYADPADGQFGEPPIDASTHDLVTRGGRGGRPNITSQVQVAAPAPAPLFSASIQSFTTTSQPSRAGRSALSSLTSTFQSTLSRPTTVTNPSLGNFFGQTPGLPPTFQINVPNLPNIPGRPPGGELAPPNGSPEVPLADNSIEPGLECSAEQTIDQSLGAFENCQPELANPTPGRREAQTLEGLPNRFVWRIYENTGRDFVPMPHFPTVVPVELQPTGNEDVRLGHGFWAFQDYALMDIDGDGNLDIVGKGLHGDGNGGFAAGGIDMPAGISGEGFLSYSVTHDAAGNVIPTANRLPRFSHGLTRLAEVNGDGLPDLIQADGDALVAHLNNGKGFDAAARTLITGFEYLDESKAEKTSTGPLVRKNTYFFADVDGDGLSDLLDLRGSTPQVHYNIGGELLATPHQLTSPAWHHASRTILQQPFDGTNVNQWSVMSDYMDANGDGVRDLVVWKEHQDRMQMQILSDRIDGAPPRQLVQVDNGSGGTIEFHYSSTSDSEVVIRGSQTDRDLPHTYWVVDTITLGDAYGPDSVTSYEYAFPTYGAQSADPDDPRRFLGFREVTKTLPLGGEVVQEFTYDVPNDARGRLVRETTLNLTSDGELLPTTERQITWTNLPLFDGRVTFTHSTDQTTTTYGADGQHVDDVFHEESTYEPELHAVGGQPVLYLLRQRDQEGGPADGAEARRTTHTYDVQYSADVYQVHKTSTERTAKLSAGSDYEAVGATRTDYDDYGRPIRVHQQIDADTWAVTVHEVDPQTGNRLSTTKPQQNADGKDVRTQFEYGPHAIYVTRTTNELGHEMLQAHDVGTGAQTERRGPNAVTVNGVTEREGEKWVLDGLGRVTEHFIAFASTDGGYEDKLVASFQYVDSPRRSVTERRVVSFDDGATMVTGRNFDGWGRLTDEVVSLDGTDDVTQSDAVTEYAYFAGGELQEITQPHPDSDDWRNRVRYTYERDSLGRVSRLIRPDGNGMTVEYAGLTKTVAEETADGSGGVYVAHYDVFGRLVQLDERGGASGPGIWNYVYDANDNVAKIHNPDGDATTIEHDFAGRRTTITRGDRTWTYRYDLNGNLLAETTPMPGGADAVEHTTAFRYDDLDRVVRRTAASRGMTDARMDELGIGPIEYHYDGAGEDSENAVGRLSRVDLPFGHVTYTYDARGLATREARSFSVDYLATASASQWVERDYNALGLATLIRHDDGTETRSTYDARGLVDTVEWFDPTQAEWQEVADYERSLAGGIKYRTSDFNQARAFAYDELGRPVRDSIYFDNGASPMEQLAWRTYDYSDSGDLTATDGETLQASAAASYAYDGLHRLLRASGPNGYEGEFAYSAAGNVDEARVGWNGSNASRDVRYAYGAVDPQAVDALFDQATGEQWGSFSYDQAGNMLTRSTPEGSTDFTWDGENQLREAEGTGGREAYYYDHNGQRMLAVTEDGVRFWFGASEAHYDADGNQTERYIHVADPGGTLARVENGESIELQYADALQNLMLTVSADGTPTSSFLYGAFGEVVDSHGGDDHTRRFNGKEDDAATGLRYYGFRYYDPLTLRWNSADPLYTFVPDLGLTEPQRMNVYAFSLNNPVRYYDPDGRDSNDTCQIDGAGCSGTLNDKKDADKNSPVQTEEYGPVTVTTTTADGGVEGPKITNDGVTVVKAGGTLGKVDARVGGPNANVGVTVTALDGGIDLGIKDNSLQGSIGGQAGTIEASGEACFLIVCVGGSVSFGPQAQASASVGQKTGGKLGLGVVGVGAHVRFGLFGDSGPAPFIEPYENITDDLYTTLPSTGGGLGREAHSRTTSGWIPEH